MYQEFDLEFFKRLLSVGLKEKDEGFNEDACCECGSLLGLDNQPFIVVKDIKGDRLFALHRKCLEKTKRGVFDYDTKKRKLKGCHLKKLWKFKGKPSELQTNSPKILIIREIVPEGVNFHLMIPEKIKLVNLGNLKKIESKVIGFEEMSEHYDKGPWGKEFFEQVYRETQSWKEKHAYEMGFRPIVTLLVRGIPRTNNSKKVSKLKDLSKTSMESEVD